MKKVLVWETLATVSGGQKMTLTVMEMLRDEYEFLCLIPDEGGMSEELKKRKIPYKIMGDQSLPTGVKGKSVIFRYGWMSVQNILKSLIQIFKYKPDVLYAPGPAALPWSAVCGLLTRKPVIWHLHHIFLDNATRKLLNVCAEWKTVKKIIAVSNCVGDQIESPKGHKKVKVLYNPVDVEKYANGIPNKILKEIEDRLERKICAGGGVLILTQIGAITENKRQIRFVETICELKKRGHEVIGLLVGEAVTEVDRIYKNELLALIRKYDLEKDILEMGYRKDIADILAITDCVVVPSEEGLGLVALEAMSAKTHVVGMDSGGTGELFEAAGCGITYPTAGSHVDIADAILKTKSETKEIIEAGYRFCTKLNHENYRNHLRQIFG